MSKRTTFGLAWRNSSHRQRLGSFGDSMMWLMLGMLAVPILASDAMAQGVAIVNEYQVGGVAYSVGSPERTRLLSSLGEHAEPVYDAERAYIMGHFNAERTVWPFCAVGGRAQAAYSRDRQDGTWHAICQYVSGLHNQVAVRRARDAVGDARRRAIESSFRVASDRVSELRERLNELDAWDADDVDRLLSDIARLEVPVTYIPTIRYDDWGRELGEGRRNVSDVFPGLEDPGVAAEELKSDARSRLLDLLRDEVTRDLGAAQLPFDDFMLAASDAVTQASRMELMRDRQMRDELVLAIGRRGSELIEQSFGPLQQQALQLRWTDDTDRLRQVVTSLAGMRLVFDDEHDAEKVAAVEPALAHVRAERQRSADVASAIFELCYEIPRIEAAMRENARANARVDRRSGTIDLAERRTLAEDAEDLRASEREAKATLRAAGIQQARACREYQPPTDPARSVDRQESRLRDRAMSLEEAIMDARHPGRRRGPR